MDGLRLGSSKIWRFRVSSGRAAQGVGALAASLFLLVPAPLERGVLPPGVVESRVLLRRAQALEARPKRPRPYHPPHVVKVWMVEHRGRVFRCIQLPRCEHMEAILSLDWNGQTLEQAKKRHGGVAACTDGFIHSRNLTPADFLQANGRRLSRAVTGRWMLVIQQSGALDIHGNYFLVKGKEGVTAAALGQRLVPLAYDGFSKAFMNRVTERMGIGLTNHHIFIAAGRSDIWRFSKLFSEVLHCKVAINTDGGHVVRGRSSTHIVFRWKTQQPITR
jgi:hypothetical protein